jgi:hypothetical protein
MQIELQRGQAHTEAPNFAFHTADPRVIAVPVNADQIAALGFALCVSPEHA